MKVRPITVFLALILMVPVLHLQAGRGGGMGGMGRGMRGPMTPQPAAVTNTYQPGTNKFGDLPLKTKFYFISDTNHTYLWTKISTTSGSNAVSSAIVTIKAPQLVLGQ